MAQTGNINTQAAGATERFLEVRSSTDSRRSAGQEQPRVALVAATAGIFAVFLLVAGASSIRATTTAAQAEARGAGADEGLAEPGPEDVLLQQLRRLRGTPDASSKEFILHSSVGNLFSEHGRYAKAMQHYEAAASLAHGDPQRVATKQAMANVLFRQGRLRQAKEVLDAAMRVPGALAGEHAATLLHTLGNVQRDMGQTGDAIQTYKHARVVAEARAEGGPEDLDDLPQLVADTADAYAREGNLDEASAKLQEASRLWETSHRTHKGAGLVRAQIDGLSGDVHQMRGDAAKSIELYRRALRTQAQSLSPQHPELVATRLSLARAQRHVGEITGALKTVEDQEAAIRAGPQEGPDLSRALGLKADLLRETQQLEAANQAIKEAMRLQDAAFGPDSDHPEAAVARNIYGGILQDQGKYREALVEYQRALALNLATVGPNNLETAAAHNNLGTLYFDMNQVEEAQKHFTSCLEVQAAVLGNSSPEIANTLNNLATIVFRLGESEEAAKMLRRALKVLDAASVPKGSPERATYEENLQEVLDHIDKEAEERRSPHQRQRSAAPAASRTSRSIVRAQEVL